MRYLTSAFWTGRRLLLDDPPDWSGAIETRHEVPAEIESGLDSRERRATRSFNRIRVGQAWTVTVAGKEFAAARDALQTFQNEALLIPVWPFITAPAAVSPKLFANFWLAAWPDGSATVIADVAAGAGASSLTPLMVGRWREDPRVSLLSSVAAQYHLDAEDNGEGIFITAGTYPAGPNAGDGQSRPVLPGWPNFADAQRAGTSPLPVIWQEHKPSLTRQSAFYARPAGRDYEFTFDLTSQTAALDWLGFWSDRAGPSGLLWLPSFASEGAGLLADAPAGATSLQVDITGAGNVVNRGLALFSAPVLEVVRIASYGGTTATLATPLVRSWAAQDTLAGIAALARFTAAELRLSWSTSQFSHCQALFTETPWEYTTPPGETANTQGTLGALIHLYTFERWTSAGLSETRRYTDAAEGALIGGVTYGAAPYSHQDVTQSLNLEDDQITLHVRSFTGDPLTELVSGATPADSLWRVEIAESIAGGSPRVLFYGELTTVRAEGPWFEGACVRLGGLPERKFPSALVQTTCNYALFSRGCGLASASWQFLGHIAAANGVNVTVASLTPPGGFAGTAFPGFFQGGLFISQIQTARIMADVPSGPDRLLTLERAPNLNTGPTEGCELWPGCDGQHTTCRPYSAGSNPGGKFNNFARFGGFPWVPLANPTTSAIRNPAPAAGKK